MSRWVYLLGVGLALVALAFVVTDRPLTPPPGTGVTEENVKRLRPGMALKEVEAILGRPILPQPVEAPGKKEILQLTYQGPGLPGENGAAVLALGADGRLKRAEWKPFPNAPTAKTGLLARLRAWLGW